MNLLYLVAGDILTKKDSGVTLKILAKANALKDLGINTTVIGFSNSVEENINEFCSVKKINNINVFTAIENYLKEQGNKFDKILFRYPFADKELLELVKQHKDKIFFEHNTFEIEEAALVQKRHLKTLPFSLSPSYLSYWYKTNILKTNAEKEMGGDILKYAKGGICVTKELAAYEKKKCPSYKTYVVSNGSESDVEILKSNPLFTNTLKTFMLVGDNAPWQGFERIIEGLKKFKDKTVSIELNIIGVEKPSVQISGLPANCTLKFTCKSKNYFSDNNLQDYHLTFSTLALYKKGMQEAASLKLRDCMLRGFPVALAYIDTDVSENPSFAPYTLQFPNNNSAIDFNKVLSFYKSVSAIENYPEKIRELALNTFSYKVKAMQLKQILEAN